MEVDYFVLIFSIIYICPTKKMILVVLLGFQ